ncbi:unnamed protein product [Bursaphelenchus okinawaensis]|uniref:ZSWIM3 N-terminal domain-containing protein n=1 Tax=Bursaphelenchus okinawaensis TaxID=465554 RepID=A0A811KPJ3_9BILA|nr:unnamed protein product [Bursaphelenchus okinawaensis]CAG9106924.1 unnamed protein product [Bursaphelenchus okinawaensis]
MDQNGAMKEAENQENTTISDLICDSNIFALNGRMVSSESQKRKADPLEDSIDQSTSSQPSQKRPKKPIKVPREQSDDPRAAEFSSKDDGIYMGAEFKDWHTFNELFKKWMGKHNQPFRISSSDKFTNADGSWNEKVGYRSIVYHCPRYGDVRVRGEGKRMKQMYLPCQCTATIRLNYHSMTQVLRITTFRPLHNHELNEEEFTKLKIKRAMKQRNSSSPLTVQASSGSSSEISSGPSSTNTVSPNTMSAGDILGYLHTTGDILNHLRNHGDILGNIRNNNDILSQLRAQAGLQGLNGQGGGLQGYVGNGRLQSNNGNAGGQNSNIGLQSCKTGLQSRGTGIQAHNVNLQGQNGGLQGFNLADLNKIASMSQQMGMNKFDQVVNGDENGNEAQNGTRNESLTKGNDAVNDEGTNRSNEVGRASSNGNGLYNGSFDGQVNDGLPNGQVKEESLKVAGEEGFLNISDHSNAGFCNSNYTNGAFSKLDQANGSYPSSKADILANSTTYPRPDSPASPPNNGLSYDDQLRLLNEQLNQNSLLGNMLLNLLNIMTMQSASSQQNIPMCHQNMPLSQQLNPFERQSTSPFRRSGTGVERAGTPLGRIGSPIGQCSPMSQTVASYCQNGTNFGGNGTALGLNSTKLPLLGTGIGTNGTSLAETGTALQNVSTLGQTSPALAQTGSPLGQNSTPSGRGASIQPCLDNSLLNQLRQALVQKGRQADLQSQDSLTQAQELPPHQDIPQVNESLLQLSDSILQSHDLSLQSQNLISQQDLSSIHYYNPQMNAQAYSQPAQPTQANDGAQQLLRLLQTLQPTGNRF